MNASALLGDIIAVARSIDAVGLCGVNVAEASEMLLAMPTTSALSLCSVRSGTVHRRYPTITRGHQRDGRDSDDSQPQPWTVVVGADGAPNHGARARS